MFKEDCEGAGGSGGNEIKWEEDVNSWEARKEANQSRIRREREMFGYYVLYVFITFSKEYSREAILSLETAS